MRPLKALGKHGTKSVCTSVQAAHWHLTTDPSQTACWHSDMLGIALCCEEEVCWRSRHSRFPLLLYLRGMICHEPTVRPLAERDINTMVHVLKCKSLTFLGSVSPAFFLKDC